MTQHVPFDSKGPLVRRELADLSRRVNELVEAARKCEICAKGVEDPLWTEVLVPFLQAEIDAFMSAAMDMRGEDAEELRLRARLARNMREMVLTSARPGDSEKYLEEAKRLQEILDRNSAQE